jgi:hypothetical protein
MKTKELRVLNIKTRTFLEKGFYRWKDISAIFKNRRVLFAR